MEFRIQNKAIKTLSRASKTYGCIKIYKTQDRKHFLLIVEGELFFDEMVLDHRDDGDRIAVKRLNGHWIHFLKKNCSLVSYTKLNSRPFCEFVGTNIDETWANDKIWIQENLDDESVRYVRETNKECDH